MKEVAYGALFLGFVGVTLMVISAVYADDSLTYNCNNNSYLVENYGHDGEDEKNQCESDEISKIRSSLLYEDIGYALLIFSLVLMVGSNRLQDK